MAWLKQKDNVKPILNRQEQTTETQQEEDVAICIKCKYHKADTDDYEHACFANVEETTDYVTGEKTVDGVEDCEDVNSEGDCSDFEEKD